MCISTLCNSVLQPAGSSPHCNSSTCRLVDSYNSILVNCLLSLYTFVVCLFFSIPIIYYLLCFSQPAWWWCSLRPTSQAHPPEHILLLVEGAGRSGQYRYWNAGLCGLGAALSCACTHCLPRTTRSIEPTSLFSLGSCMIFDLSTPFCPCHLYSCISYSRLLAFHRYCTTVYYSEPHSACVLPLFDAPFSLWFASFTLLLAHPSSSLRIVSPIKLLLLVIVTHHFLFICFFLIFWFSIKHSMYNTFDFVFLYYPLMYNSQ